MFALRWVRTLAVVLSAAWFLPAGSAFTATPANAAVPDAEEARSAVRTGVDLERSRQWLKAIRHYEKALKSFPHSDEIRFGLRRSRIHFSIARRYLDRSFETRLLTKSTDDALDLFDDVLRQVKGSYVEPLSSTSFVAHGTESLYLALVDTKFAARNLRGVSQERVRRMRKLLRDQYWNKPVAHGGAARMTVARVAATAETMLGVPRTAVVMEYVFGGCNSLDDYSSVLTPNRLEDLYGNIDGEFVGLGIEMKSDFGRGMLLVNVLPDSPAERAGMKRGERIVAISGTDSRNMTTDAASRLLRGRSGTSVRLLLESADGERTRTLVVVRREVHIKSIPVAEIIDRRHGIAYIQMNGFQKTTSSELDDALQKLHRAGMRSLIWDVRGNPGGLLTAAVEVLDRFIDNGVLVSTRGRSRDQNWTYSAHRSQTWSVPIVLLVDGDSASASEIVAGAIRDHKRGLLVGRQTYGKWSVQSIFPMNDRMGLRLTTAKFYSPNGGNYTKVGVKPDVVVEQAPKDLLRYRAPQTAAELRADTDLSKALEILRRRADRP
jgi:carboxyl-terminal processing protease